jgi:hypothetical protein
MNLLHSLEIEDPSSPKAVKLMTSGLSGTIPNYVKVLLYPDATAVLAAYGQEAYRRLRNRRDAEAMQAAGFDVEATLHKLNDADRTKTHP